MRDRSGPRGIVRVIGISLVALGVAAGGGLALASDGNTIHACAHKTTGALRLAQELGACHVSETTVEWNIQGLQGPQGPPATRLFLAVRSGHLGVPTPVIFGSSGVTGVERIQPGLYEVKFDQDVALCSAVASPSSFNGAYPGNRTASTVHWPHMESMRDTIGVRTQRFVSSLGDFVDEDHSFSLTVTC